MSDSFGIGPVELFKNVRLFSGLDHAELTQILRMAQPISFLSGDRLFEEGSPADGLYVIELGEVEVVIHHEDEPDLVLAHLGNGSVIGEMALIDGGARSASVAVISPTQGYFLHRDRFEQLRNSGETGAYKIIHSLAQILDERRRQLQNRVDQLRLEPPIGVLERATKELAARVRKA